MMINASYSAGSITSASADAFMLHDKSCFGEKKGKSIEYSSIEALFLAQQQKLAVFTKGKEITYDSLLAKLKKSDKKITTKLAVYADLRQRGYLVKSALKFGAEFRVYNKGDKPGKEHARWILYTTREHEVLHWHEFAAKNRVAHATKKNLLIAIVDDEGDVSYYEVSWLKP